MSTVSVETLVRHSDQPLKLFFKPGPDGYIGLGRLHTLHVRKVLEIRRPDLPVVLAVVGRHVSMAQQKHIEVTVRFCGEQGRHDFLRTVARDVTLALVSKWDD